MTTPLAPRTGASSLRKNKMAPLLTPIHQKLISMNNSQVQGFSPISGGFNTEFVSPLDIEREKQKIARFINTKERHIQELELRELSIEKRLKEKEGKHEKQKKENAKKRKEAMAELF
jgi:hypothetical protein